MRVRDGVELPRRELGRVRGAVDDVVHVLRDEEARRADRERRRLGVQRRRAVGRGDDDGHEVVEDGGAGERARTRALRLRRLLFRGGRKDREERVEPRELDERARVRRSALLVVLLPLRVLRRRDGLARALDGFLEARVGGVPRERAHAGVSLLDGVEERRRARVGDAAGGVRAEELRERVGELLELGLLALQRVVLELEVRGGLRERRRDGFVGAPPRERRRQQPSRRLSERLALALAAIALRLGERSAHPRGVALGAEEVVPARLARRAREHVREQRGARRREPRAVAFAFVRRRGLLRGVAFLFLSSRGCLLRLAALLVRQQRVEDERPVREHVRVHVPQRVHGGGDPRPGSAELPDDVDEREERRAGVRASPVVSARI